MHHLKAASVDQVSIIGLDIAKSVFQAHGADASDCVEFRKKIARATRAASIISAGYN